MVKLLGKKYNGIACEENYHELLIADLSREEFPCLTYTRDLKNWSDFIRRTPDEYEAWVNGCTGECAILELKLLEKLEKQNTKIFVDTNIPLETLIQISDKDHVVIMLADPDISVKRFFDHPDKEKQLTQTSPGLHGMTGISRTYHIRDIPVFIKDFFFR